MTDAVYARTERLIWRQGAPEDVGALHAIVSDFDVVRQTETWPWPVERAFTEERCIVPLSPDCASGVVTDGTGVVGYLGLSRGGKLGYMFGKPHWGQGYATEIGRAAIEFAFTRMAWPKLSACVFSDNPASGRVLEKLGFGIVGPCECPSAARGGVFPIINYALDRPKA